MGERSRPVHHQKPCGPGRVQRPRERHLDDTAALLKRLQPILDVADQAAGHTHRLWAVEDGAATVLHGRAPGWMPNIPPAAAVVGTPDGPRWFEPVGDQDGLWLEGEAAGNGPAARTLSTIELVDHLLRSEREVTRLSQELATRYEEIDLLYTISEILGQTVRLEQAAQIIVGAVSSVVGARRASIMVHDEKAGSLRTVAAQGIPPGRAGVIQLDDPRSIAARVFREGRALIGDPIEGTITSVGQEERGYQGVAFMSVPICYATSGSPSRCIGVVNLTDRVGGDRFTQSDRKLVAAIANQIGAALENARLVEREREQERLERELELAQRLQQGLMPSPAVLHGDAQVGVRCLPLESVGGDFYTFSRLGQGCVGVMLGDVSSHGISAALLMASVMAAAGVHTAATSAPEDLLAGLRDSLAEKLATAESYFTVFYGMLDPSNRRLTYANAGHAHAFRVSGDGPPIRLEATAPPLGLGTGGRIESQALEWRNQTDLLCLFTDGLADASSPDGERFGEQRILDAIAGRRDQHPEAIVSAVMAEVDRFAPEPADDRTLLVLKLTRG